MATDAELAKELREAITELNRACDRVAAVGLKYKLELKQDMVMGSYHVELTSITRSL